MMRIISSLVLLVLLGLHLALAHEQHIEVAEKKVEIDDICKNRQVPIISVSEALRLIKDLREKPESCPEKYVQSFYELEPILYLERGERVERICNESKFEQIKDYHFRYINPMEEKYTLGDDLNKLGKKIVRRPLTEEKVDYKVQLDDYKQEIQIPISLQQFFKAWALQVSGICKRSFVENLENAVQMLTVYDMDTLAEAAKQTASGNVTENPIKMEKLTFDELVYLPRLEGEIHEGDTNLRESVTLMDLRTNPVMNRLMHACKTRFKPIYDQLVMPIVRLSKLGYDYVGKEIDDISNKLEKDKEVRRWMALTLMCEAPGNFELIEDPDQKFEMPELHYEPVLNHRVDGVLWIKGAEALSKEFNRINGYKSTGWKKFLFNTGVMGRKAVAIIDPHRSAWYRRNQNTLSSGLNVLSILSNGASIILSVLNG